MFISPEEGECSVIVPGLFDGAWPVVATITLAL